MENENVRQITDSRVLAALAHPLRRRLMDALKVYGPCTASMLADHTGQAVANVSHHLRVLASGELVEEAPELARDRRERWWRLVSASLRWSTRDFESDPASAAVAGAAESINLDHHVGIVRAYYAMTEDERAAWENAPFSADKWLRLTPAELAELSGEVIALFERWAARDVPDDGARRDPVFLFAFGVPGRP
ncbi:transcriptional regulator [Sphaerisporangium krabiense]|uniref:DNA-binding transcriptional ArsR family regulator n=1 Tax=Sphaerisporangium krabiense TaxID=763782 RepID=A0A7W8Z843_9ACTN|nr:metalloregulator ArsR/SmtB family transcription factor [Sphaerisporangium krabiense]MBB5629162.1 DNA-binding transcriptional ArsR family regulator [Sphaerisporangium krabiense]GII59997.1 transcriptional regulator [Sphaerisporangium krabiense]